MFEQASRIKLRFKTAIGVLTVEDLWSLSLFKLDSVAKSLNKEVKESEEESFISEKSSENTLVNLRFDIVKHVIKLKLDEAKASKDKVEVEARRAKIMQVMANKQDSSLESLSMEELAEELKKL